MIFNFTKYELQKIVPIRINSDSVFYAGNCPFQLNKKQEDDIRFFEINNIKMVVNLLPKEEIRMGSSDFYMNFFALKKITVDHFPITDRSVPKRGSMEHLSTLLSEISYRLVQKEKIFIHCHAGLGRTGLLSALILIKFGLNSKTAIEVVRNLRKGSIETTEQENFILNYLIT